MGRYIFIYVYLSEGGVGVAQQCGRDILGGGIGEFKG